MPHNQSVQHGLDLINEFLTPVRAQAEKEAAMAKSADDGSFKDTAAANPEKQADPKSAATSQNNLGQEQSQAAKDSGSTAPDEAPNNEANAKQMADTQGPQTLDTDQPVTSSGNIGPRRSQEITQEQKTARANRLGDAILQQIGFSKQATTAPDGQPGGTVTEPVKTQTPVAQPAAIPMDADESSEGGDKTASAENTVLNKLAAVAAENAQTYYEGYLSGLIKRAQDEHELSQVGIDQAVLAQAGGISGLLDKVAMETPEAVLPEGVDLGGAAMPEEAGLPGGMPAEGLSGMSPEAGPEELAAALDEAGVTPEELEQALQDITALQEAGVSPEDLAAAISSEMGGEEGLPPEAAMEAPPMPGPAEASAPEEIPKEASARAAGINRVWDALAR